MSTKDTVKDFSERRNIARFCVENPHVSWALLFFVLFWGYFGYQNMPKSKDPNIPVRIAMVITPWPGHSAVEIEQLITKQVEAKIAESEFLKSPDSRSFSIKSLTISGVSMVQVQLAPGTDRDVAFNDIARKLSTIEDQLPQGAGPITVNSEFGDTAAVLLSVASPRAGPTEVALRANSIATSIEDVRAGAAGRVSLIVARPMDLTDSVSRSGFRLLKDWLEQNKIGQDVRYLQGSGFVGADFISDASDGEILASVNRFLHERLGADRFFPDAWEPTVVRSPESTATQLAQVVGDKYSYRQLEEYSETLSANFKTIPQVSRVLRSGVLTQQINLTFSQEQLASYGVLPSRIGEVLSARETTVPGGMIPVADIDVLLAPDADFTNEQAIGDVVITRTADGLPVYLRDLLEIQRGYQNPPRLLSYYLAPDENGAWQRHNSVGLAIQMHANEQIADLGVAVDEVLEQTRLSLPDDLITQRISDQPTQVRENIDLFLRALYEAIILVVIVAFVGFWEWRSALLLMVAIPITLAMTFGVISVLGIDIQQVSIVALIIALGLLVDDPVVAGDSIKRSMAEGRSRQTAAWLGPTLLATAILFATITNTVAYLPFLLLTGNQGDFLHSLPIVMAAALISSRIVSMTFVPFLGSMLLKPEGKQKSMEERKNSGFTGVYYRMASYAIDHRKKVLVIACLLLAAGLAVKTQLKNAFFPPDVQYIFTVDIWLQNNANIQASSQLAAEVEKIVESETADYRKDLGLTEPILRSITTTVGGGAPRFWFTVNPEQHQTNYAQLIVRLTDKDLTPGLVPRLQRRLSQSVSGAAIDVKQLQTTPVQYPVAIRLSSRSTPGSEGEAQDIVLLQEYANKIVDVLQASPAARTVRNDWGGASLVNELRIDEDKASLSGLNDQDIALSSLAAFSGVQVGVLREGDRQTPIVAQLEFDQRARISDLSNLYVYSMNSDAKLPLMSIASSELTLRQERIRRLEQFRTVTVFAYPADGFISSQIMGDAQADLDKLQSELPEGFTLQISGDQANTVHGFSELIKVMGISALAIFLALVFQFKNLIKPLLVFAAVPFGMAGALIALLIMNQPFGFMAFLGIVSLIGVIVSHIIVLFDFIEDRHKQGAPFRQAVLEAGVMRLRPVLITIAATTLALFPLARDGGPLWQGLCYAQIGGLMIATIATLILVPTLYALVVLDLKWIRWNASTGET
ncbi:MAG: efflux RND transporter permease subunit [Pseudomonadota bacterium]